MGRCKAKTEVYSRVCGYYRPVQNWNPGKRAEFHDRVPYAVGKAVHKQTPNPPVVLDTPRKEKS